jgi:hypothetical protein
LKWSVKGSNLLAWSDIVEALPFSKDVVVVVTSGVIGALNQSAVNVGVLVANLDGELFAEEDQTEGNQNENSDDGENLNRSLGQISGSPVSVLPNNVGWFS